MSSWLLTTTLRANQSVTKGPKSDRETLSLSRTAPRWSVLAFLPQPFLRPKRHRQLIFSVFKTLTDQTVIVELKNDLLITGVLKSVDQSAS